jgi:putative transposase
MARLPRYLVPGQPRRVVHRGNVRQAVFGDERDCRFYLKCLTEAA